MESLNPQQRAAIEHLDGPLLVVAGAGSGKTRVITRKIVHLVREADLPARRIAAVTFTNKAAREMQQRIGQLLPKNERRGLRVATFHTLGLTLLKESADLMGYRPGFSILDPRDGAALIQSLVQEAGYRDVDAEAVRRRISSWKNDLRGPDTMDPSEFTEPWEEALPALYARYQDHLRAYNAVDFDDLIRLPVDLLGNHDGVRARWRGRLRYLLVDEYQDTNLSQYALMHWLVGPNGAFTAVGDDDQSVYTWRGARPENLARLKADHPRLTIIKLEQNYRSQRRILRAANHVIANNPHVVEKRLWSELGEGEPIRILQCKDSEDEADRVVGALLRHRFQNAGAYRDYAILYRGNFQSKTFEKALRTHRIPYFVSGGTAFFDRNEIRDLVAYFRLLANTEDDAALLRIINTPRRELGPTTVERLGHYAQRRGVSLLVACFELGLKHQLPERAAVRLEQFAEWLVARADEAHRGDPVTTLERVIEEIDYPDYLTQMSHDSRAAERSLGYVHELVAWLRQRLERSETELSVVDLAQYLVLMGILDREEDAGRQDAVNLMTLHGAKGLEFPHVYLVGLEEESLPHHEAEREGRLEEERRLFYVGMTRARQTLTLTWSRTRQRAGERVNREPSRFLDELPEREIEREGGPEVDPVAKRERGRAQLANLKAILNSPAEPQDGADG
jgi:ATP-dependent DNA helicase Rep